MNNTTILIPVSRLDYIDQIFHRLELLICDRARTNILTIVDGDSQLFTKVRNLTELSKFGERLCVQFISKNPLRQFDILGRRNRIASIHNFAKQYINSGEFVFGIEDDTIVPSTALKNLMTDFSYEPFAGFIQGVELGRWGISYVGAWRVNDIYEPTLIESLPEGEGLQPIDAGGLYCFLTRTETYLNHEFKTFENNGLGPDVDFGISLRREGMQNFIDWKINCIHKSKDKDIILGKDRPSFVSFIKKNNQWRQNSKFRQ